MAGTVGGAVRVQADDLTDVVRALRALENGKELRKRLRKELRSSMSPAVPAIRTAVKAIPSKGESAKRGRPGLRKATARATRLQVTLSTRRAGVTVRVDPRKMPTGMHNLPAYLNGEPPFQQWRVPVRGGGYRVQRAHPYFAQPIRRFQPQAIRSIDGVVESIRRQLEQ